MKDSENFKKWIPHELFRKYDMYSFDHASCILANDFSKDHNELMTVLGKFNLTRYDVVRPAKGKSPAAKQLDELMKLYGWFEGRPKMTYIPGMDFRTNDVDPEIIAKLNADKKEIVKKSHHVDYMKYRIYCELEYSTNDTSYQRDLKCFADHRELSQCSVGIIITRSDEFFDAVYNLPEQTRKPNNKSVTIVSKLLKHLDANAAGRCPVLVVAMRPEIIVDLHEDYIPKSIDTFMPAQKELFDYENY